MKDGTRYAVLGLFGLVAVAATGPAKALTFGFSFANDFNGGGQVTGRIYGLEDNLTGPASRVIVNSNDAGFGVGIYSDVFRPNPFSNFTVTNGELTHLNYQALGINNASPLETCCSLFMISDSLGVHAGLTNSPSSANYGLVAFTTTPIFGEPTPPPIPLPTPLLMLTSALISLGSLAWLGRRRRV